MSNGKLCDPNSCSLVGKLQLKSDRWKTIAEQAETRENVLRKFIKKTFCETHCEFKNSCLPTCVVNKVLLEGS